MGKIDRLFKRRGSKDRSRELKWYKKLSWFTILGSLLLFGSWISQNYYRIKWSDERARLLRSQLVIDIEEARSDMWDIYFTEKLNDDKVHIEVLAAAALKDIEVRMQISSWMEGRVASDAASYQRILSQRDESLSKAREYYQTKNYKALVELAHQTREVTDIFVPSQDQRFSTLVNEVNASEQFWNNLFLFPYILGSVLVGVGFVKKELSNSIDARA